MANLFDKLNSSFVSDTQSSHLDTSSEVEQTTIDVDALTGFTIPRKKRKTDFSLEEVAQDSRSFKDIVSVVERSFKGKDKEIFTCSKCFLVHNADRLKAFLEKKTELKDGKDVHESYAFQMFSSDHDAKAVCKAGLRVGNTNMSFLGKADLGVYVCKHADMMTSKKLSRGFIGRMVVYKVLKGKVKFVTENWTGEALEPTPNFDCHVSKTSAATYESAQLYLYEYDEDFEIVEKPRQVLPYALVYFTLTKDQRQSTSAVLTAHRAGSFNLPLEKHPLFQRSNSTDLTGVVPSTEPVSQQVITAADRASNQQEVDDSSLNPQSTTGANVSPVKKTPDLPAKQRVGKPGADGKGVVVWTGNMISDGGLPLCEVDMISYASPITPGLLDNQLMISKTVSWSSLISLVFNNVVSLSRESETRVCEMYYSYFQINPTDGHQEMFKAFIAYLNKKQRGAYVILENSKAVLLPACLVTHNFKLTEPDEPSENLHCILISQQPRAIELKGRISSKDNGPKEQTKNGSQLGVLCYPEPDLLYEAGFLPSLPATCYIFLEALREDCIRQGEAQDKRNIEEARKERYKQSMSNRSLSTQSSDGGSCSQPPLCSDKMKALPFGLESLKRHPLFAVNPPVSDMNRDIKAYSDRITSSAGFSETSQTSSSGYSSLGPAVYKSPLLSETPAARTTLPPQGARSYQYSTSQRSFTDSTQSVLLRSPTGSNPQQCSATSVGAVDIVNIAGNPYANNPAFVNSNPAGNLCANDPAVGNSSQSRLHDNAPSMPYQSAIGSSSTCSEPLNNLSAITSDNHSVLGSKPSTTRRSLIMSLPLPPGEDLSNYKQLKTTSLSSKHKSRKIISSESEGSSSSSEESEEDALADDLVDGIIKMRPVKEVLSLSKHKKNSSGENEASPAKTATITAAVRPELGSFVITKTSKEKSESKGESRLSKGTEKSLQVNDVIDSCVSTALHRKVAPKATAKSEEEQANWSQFWSVALHYLLPLKNILKQAAVLDSEKHSAVSSNKDSLSRQPFNFGRDMAILAKKSLREYYDLPALTHSQFSSRFQQFKTRAKQVISKSGRFVGLQFQRSTLQEVDEARKQGNKEEIEEYEFTEKDVKNFDELVTTSRSSPS